jgi:hypothetical protein
VFCHNIVHLFHQIQTLKGDVPGSLLEITDAERLIFLGLLVRAITAMLHQPDGNIVAVIRNYFAPA